MSELRTSEPIHALRHAASAEFESLIPPAERSRFDAVRQAMVVRKVLDYYGIQLPEAYSLPGEIRDLCMRLVDAEQLTPALRHFL